MMTICYFLELYDHIIWYHTLHSTSIAKNSILPPSRSELFDDNDFGVIRHSGRGSIPSMTVPTDCTCRLGSKSKHRSILPRFPTIARATLDSSATGAR